MQIGSHRGSSDEEDPASLHREFRIRLPAGLQLFHRTQEVITVADMEEMADEVGEASRRLMEAGFDGVMIHCASGYLACELLSRRFNKRTDAYGGDLKGRAKFILDTIRATREKTAPNFPIILRLMGSDRVSKPGDSEGWGSRRYYRAMQNNRSKWCCCD